MQNFMVGGNSAWNADCGSGSIWDGLTESPCKRCKLFKDSYACKSDPRCPLYIPTITPDERYNQHGEGEWKPCANPKCDNRIYLSRFSDRNVYDNQKCCNRACATRLSNLKTKQKYYERSKWAAENYASCEQIMKKFGIKSSSAYKVLSLAKKIIIDNTSG